MVVTGDMILLGSNDADIEEDNLEEAPIEAEEKGEEKDQEEQGDESKEEASKKARFDPSQVKLYQIKITIYNNCRSSFSPKRLKRTIS